MPVQNFVRVDGRPAGAPQYYVMFDHAGPRAITGLRIGVLTLQLPDGAIEDKFYEYAKTLWHLKDRMHQWIKATKQSAKVDEWIAQSTPLLICADLANYKKHGRHQQQSDILPKLRHEITFDTSKSGVIEIYYEGALKRKVLYVSNPTPIAFKATIVREDDDSKVIGDALSTMDAGQKHWLPFIMNSGVLAPSDPESKALLNELP